jgi:hypothetical protein
MCTIKYGMMMNKMQKKKQAKVKKKGKKSNHMFLYRFRSFETKKNSIYFVGGAVDRYRADFGLSTFNDGRGIFD